MRPEAVVSLTDGLRAVNDPRRPNPIPLYYFSMFRLFQHIRENSLATKKSRKYLHYAIGEIILVVLGILIALQIDNWNEERIEQQQIADYAHSLIKDLERDLIMAAVIKKEIDVLIEKIDTLAEYIETRPIEEFKNIDLFYLMRAPFYRPYAWNRTALEQIKSSGALRQMKNQELAEKISAYESFTYHLEGDFEFDREVGIESVQLAGTIVDMNYPRLFEQFSSRSPDSFSFPDSPLHMAYKDTNLALLTDDINEIRRVVNNYLILGGHYGIRPRADTEMAMLEERANELIVLLTQEYP
jgi:hypothetical protein